MGKVGSKKKRGERQSPGEKIERAKVPTGIFKRGNERGGSNIAKLV